MKLRHFLLLLTVSLALGVPTIAADAASKKHRIVFELVSDGKEAWDGLLNNVENAQKSFGAETTEIEVVAHSKGLGLLLKESEVRERLEKLAGTGVKFAACENTMKKKNVTKEQLLPVATTVDSGVAEVVRKQEAGWAYLKSRG